MAAEEFEAEEVHAHLGESSQAFRNRVLGKIKGQEMGGSNADLALYALYTDVLVVVIRADLVTPTSSFVEDEKVACTELWFDSLVECAKSRVVCVVLDRKHFQLGVGGHLRFGRSFSAAQNGTRLDVLFCLLLKRARPLIHLGHFGCLGSVDLRLSLPLQR